MPVQCSKKIFYPFSVFDGMHLFLLGWVEEDLLGCVEACFLSDPTKNVPLALRGAIDHHRLQNIPWWVEGFCCLGFVLPQIYFLLHKGRALHTLKIEKGYTFLHTQFSMCREGWGSALWVLVLAKYSMSSPMFFFFITLTCSVSPEDVPVGLLMYRIWLNSLIYWIPFLEELSAAQCRREAEWLVHHVPQTFLLSFVHLRPASKAELTFPIHVVSDNWVSQQSRALFFML